MKKQSKISKKRSVSRRAASSKITRKLSAQEVRIRCESRIVAQVWYTGDVVWGHALPKSYITEFYWGTLNGATPGTRVPSLCAKVTSLSTQEERSVHLCYLSRVKIFDDREELVKRLDTLDKIAKLPKVTFKTPAPYTQAALKKLSKSGALPNNSLD